MRPGPHLIKVIRAQIAEADERQAFIRSVADRFVSTGDRLRDELAALSRRGNLNLVLGIVTTVTGLLILGYFVLEISDRMSSPNSLVIDFIPRLSLVLLIEVFAYFFLRLYKSSLSEIKYFQNELTNVESKAIALWSSAVLEDRGAIQAVIEKLAATERNNVLEKNQTTVELEQAKLKDSNLAASIREFKSWIRGEESGG